MNPVVWSVVVIVALVSIVLYFVLKVLAKVVADHRTKAILRKEGFSEEQRDRGARGEGP